MRLPSTPIIGSLFLDVRRNRQNNNSATCVLNIHGDLDFQIIIVVVVVTVERFGIVDSVVFSYSAETIASIASRPSNRTRSLILMRT